MFLEIQLPFRFLEVYHNRILGDKSVLILRPFPFFIGQGNAVSRILVGIIYTEQFVAYLSML